MEDQLRLERVLATLQARAGDRGGYRESELVAREQALGRPIPAGARRLLAAGRGWERVVNSIRLERPEDWEFFTTPHGNEEGADPESTRGGPFFRFACGDFGDLIVLAADGRVILADHEMGADVVLAD